jgi:hypothetical protein
MVAKGLKPTGDVKPTADVKPTGGLKPAAEHLKRAMREGYGDASVFMEGYAKRPHIPIKSRLHFRS